MKNKCLLSLVVLITLFFPACNNLDDEYSNEGKVVITYLGVRYSDEYSIYAIENEKYPVYTSNYGASKEREVTLNIGNYIFQSSAYDKKGFQVKPGKTTLITIDVYNNISVVY